ncbi:hypothetical protein ATCV1_z485R [Acanthocystis turfacea chlorella virus 1]|uniref:Uncharacterized protein z485R n=1 Tax=Chlorovirus heliozoae TaxID=322019 RepID=A7K995_9PHYC|nr:hypothetical protein ATCV1_z485R [Acanthocystis turfacea chlorella virus 1]ABT16619.1 hypothetical protein ATCV1_z485R [Acanthocystis turfacea chlorella virus 1]
MADRAYPDTDRQHYPRGLQPEPADRRNKLATHSRGKCTRRHHGACREPHDKPQRNFEQDQPLGLRGIYAAAGEYQLHHRLWRPGKREPGGSHGILYYRTRVHRELSQRRR